jgi:hypothetical protein
MTSSTDDTATEPVGVVDDGDVMDADWTEDEPRRTGTLTKALVGLLLVALGFLGGVAVGRSAGGAAATERPTSGSSGGGGGGGGAATGGSTGGGAGESAGNSGAGVSAAPSAANEPGVGSPRSSVAAPPTVIVTRTQQQPAPAGSPAGGGVVPSAGAPPTAGSTPTG